MAINFDKILAPSGSVGTTKINFDKFSPVVKTPVVTQVKQQQKPSGPNPFDGPIKFEGADPTPPKPDFTLKIPTKMANSTPPSGTAKQASDPTQSASQLYQPVVDSYQNLVAKVKESFQAEKEDLLSGKLSGTKAFGKRLEILTAGAGVLVSPISTAFGVAGNTKGAAGIPGKAVNKVFEVSGKLGDAGFKKAIDILPISNEAKKNLKPAFGEIGSFVTQGVVGGVIHSAVGKAIPKKIEEKLYDDYANNVKIEVLKEQREITPEVAREVVVRAAEKTIDNLEKVKGSSIENEQNYKLTESLPRQAEDTIRIYQTGLSRDGIINEGSYVDTKITEHISRGLATEAKIFQDITKKEFDKLFEKIDDQRTSAGIYRAKTNINGEIYSKIGETSTTFAPKIADDLTRGFQEKGLLPENFNDLPQVDRFTFAESAKNTADLFKSDIERAKRIALGEEPLPTNIQPGFLLDAINEHILKTGDAELALRMTKSPLLSETSAHAQALVSYRALSKESIPNIMAEVKQARVKNVEKVKKVTNSEAKKGLKNEVRKTAPKIKDWTEFIDSLKCK